jgi:UDP-glucose 4-epimerase
VTGGAGFIGSALVDRLVLEGVHVTAYDDLSLGRREFLAGAIAGGRCTLVEAGLLDAPRLAAAIAGHDAVFHMAANSDISLGREQTDRDLRMGTLATFGVLDAMRAAGIRDVVLASTSAVYGEHTPQPTKEDAGPLLPISSTAPASSRARGSCPRSRTTSACAAGSSGSPTSSAPARRTAPSTISSGS